MLAIGLAMLLTAAHVIIPGTISIAHYLRIPAHVVAVLLIAAGTSAPELVVAVQAALNGTPEIVWGNIIGSNITNILVVLSITGLLFKINTNDLAIKKDMLLLIAITALICLPAYYFYSLPLFVGFLLVIILASYTFFLVNQKPSEQETEKNLKRLKIGLNQLNLITLLKNQKDQNFLKKTKKKTKKLRRKKKRKR